MTTIYRDLFKLGPRKVGSVAEPKKTETAAEIKARKAAETKDKADKVAREKAEKAEEKRAAAVIAKAEKKAKKEADEKSKAEKKTAASEKEPWEIEPLPAGSRPVLTVDHERVLVYWTPIENAVAYQISASFDGGKKWEERTAKQTELFYKPVDEEIPEKADLVFAVIAIDKDGNETFSEDAEK